MSQATQVRDSGLSGSTPVAQTWVTNQAAAVELFVSPKAIEATLTPRQLPPRSTFPAAGKLTLWTAEALPSTSDFTRKTWRPGLSQR